MAAQFLQREIRQYCSKPGADHYNSPVTLLIYTDPTEAQCLKPVNILWVPATLGHDTYNHIVPLLPWKCGCVSSELCLFGRSLNQEDKWRTQRKEMVQCSSCREWYHCVCLGYSLRQVARSNLDCGCRLLPQNSRRVLSKERCEEQCILICLPFSDVVMG